MARSPAEKRAATRAQRETARRVHEARLPGGKYVKVSPSAARSTVKASQVAYARAVEAGREPMPAPGTPEARQLARMASNAKYGKAPSEFLAAFQQYFYHDEKNKGRRNDADIEDEADYEADDE